MKTVKLLDIAKTIRSKNAGVDLITFDIIFPDKAPYDLVCKSGIMNRTTIANLFGIPESRIGLCGVRACLCDQVHDSPHAPLRELR